VDAEVEFIVIGGWSAILHGSARVTNDLDIYLSRKKENVRRLVVALAPYHPRLRDFSVERPFVRDEAALRNGIIFKFVTDVGCIDLLTEVNGLESFEEVKANAVKVQAFDRTVFTLDLRSLIKAKRATGRAKDLLGLPELEGLLEAEEP
jgi:hypothetical protein